VRARDFLHESLPAGPYRVFANIPFDVTSAIVAKLVGAANPPQDACLVVQREAAERLLGRPRGTLYAALLHPWFAVEVVHRFRRADFVPPPGVDVVMIRIAKRGPPLVSAADAQLHRDLVSHAFSAWQPSVGAALAPPLGRSVMARLLRAAGIDSDARPSEVPIDRWVVLAGLIRQTAAPRTLARLMGAEQRLRQRQVRLQKRHRTPARTLSLPDHAHRSQPRPPPLRLSA
jgi:23S rRNA (adenine-N6)-dimethyltransferase